MPDVPSTALPPHVALRIAVTTGRRTTRSDLVVVGSRGSVHTPLGSPDATISEFPVSRLWPTVRALLPADSVARTAPAVTPAADRVPVDAEETAVLPALVRHAVTVTVTARPTGTDARSNGPRTRDTLALRTWLLTARDLYSVTAAADGSTTVLRERAGAIAATLQWDVAGALDHLVGTLAATGAA
ncbi:hypothetical protein [Nocardioides zeae]|uniref:Uncharacterized protein n=1 Tax=Nocardioides zeae TaxID=1457234 RepID=A0AAJ1U7G6_9ACTN|nr:hypothetical protein [Nocardioides zeae]MDQ1105557.1 hypothetical protein [Nocardioides zeae]